MEIKLNDEELNEAMSRGVTSAVSKSIQSYDVECIIREKVTSSIMNVAVEEAVNNALLQTDMVGLSKAVAKEIEKAVVSLAVASLRETIVKVVFELRKGSRYLSSDEEKKLYEVVKSELEKHGK